MNTLIIGGARSGKSAHAEKLARESGLNVTYIATAHAGDGEMAQRIAHHQNRRPAHWQTVDCEIELAATLRQYAATNTCLLVDCLTLWLSNLIFAGQAGKQAEAGEPVNCPLFATEVDALTTTLPKLPGQVVLVSNEVGCGIVPGNPLSRLFADEQGRLNQRIAAACDDVFLVAAGLPMQLKRTPSELPFTP